VEDVNERQKLVLLAKLDAHFKKAIKGKTVAVWGLAFKPRTDDMREAPAIPIIEGLLKRGARVRVFDPEARAMAQRIFKSRIHYARHAYDTLKDADALLVVTEWNEFREPDFVKMKKLMKQPVIFDGRNIYNPQQIRSFGFTYNSIGRP
jgi:UDPglucose 6-dehydrogenase